MSYLIPSYWKSVNIGDPKLFEFFSDCPGGWIVEEKIDGSQVSAAVYGGELYMRSKGKQLELDTPEKMFSKTVASFKQLFSEGKLPDNTVFRGESVTSLKHNTLNYGRLPKHHVVIFGVENAITGECYERMDMECVCDRIGFEVAPLLRTHTGQALELISEIQALLQTTSMLDNALVEGVVIKRVNKQVYFMGRPVFAKLVSEAFREQHKMSWAESNPGREDILQRLVLELSGPARYSKAVQTLRELGKLEESVRDIGNIINEVKRDVVEEGESHAKEALWKWAKDKIARQAGSGVPGWWKDQLSKKLVEQLEENG